MSHAVKADLGRPAPILDVAQWVQGEERSLDSMLGHVVLIEVFQVNCPGCFLYALPHAIEMYTRYGDKGLCVLGVATAFEDFDNNTLENLQRLLRDGGLVGESLRALADQGQAKDGKWLFKIPFPVAMDKLIDNRISDIDKVAEDYIQQNLPNLADESVGYRMQVKARVMRFLQQQQYRPQTFEHYQLQGTPSHILIDKQGVLRAKHFGFFPELENLIQSLLVEPTPI